MRTSAGFFEIGLSGKMRTHTRPPRLMWRVMAGRAASIWRAVRRPRVVAFRPYSLKETLAPRVATPLLRPFCSLRYLRLAGCSMFHSRFASGFLFGLGWRRGGLLALAQHLALEHQHLNADRAVRGARLGESVLDVGAQRMQRHAAFAIPLGAGVLRRTLDHDPADRGVRELLLQVLAHAHVLGEHAGEILGVREPLRGPVAVDREAESDRIDLLSHG